MHENLVKEAIELVVGRVAEDLEKLLCKDKFLNEFSIAKKLNLTINQTRHLLYSLADRGLVSSTRKKDRRKGWYTYSWKLEPLKCLEFFREHISKRLNEIRNQIKSRETKRFYFCERCHIELTEENALLNNFVCKECGEVYSLKDNEPVLRELKKEEERLRKKLETIEVEMESVRDKMKKKILREKTKKIKGSKKEATMKARKTKSKRASSTRISAKKSRLKVSGKSKKSSKKVSSRSKKDKAKTKRKKIVGGPSVRKSRKARSSKQRSARKGFSSGKKKSSRKRGKK